MEMENGVFPEDILINILSRLPKRCIFRFKCVSKGWCHLLSDRRRVSPKTTDTMLLCKTRRNPVEAYPIHRFPGTWLSCEPPSLTFLSVVDNDGGSASVVPFLGFSLRDSFAVVGSCNGLILLEEKHIIFEGMYRTKAYVVYNPSTKLAVNVPLPSMVKSLLVGFVFDGRHRYQVVRLCDIYIADTLVFDIFSSTTGEWTTKHLTAPHAKELCQQSPPILHSEQAFLLKGAMHWLLWGIILIYHLEGEYIELIKFSAHDGGHFDFGLADCIWNSEGCLNYCRGRENGIRIWAWHDFQWQLKHSVVLQTPMSNMPYSFAPCVFNDDFEVLYLMYGTRIFSYKLETGVLKEVCINLFGVSSNDVITAAYPFLYAPVDFP